MKRIDILYDNLIYLLNQITYNEDQFNHYSDIQSATNQAILIESSENILAEIGEISKIKASMEYYPDFNKLINILDNFNVFFDDYPGFRKNELYAIISIIQKITAEYSGSDIDLNEEIDVTIFDVLPLAQPINKDNFFIFNDVTFSHSLFLFNLLKKEEFKLYIDDITSGTQTLFHLLFLIGREDIVLTENKYILVDCNFLDNVKVVWATLCLHIVMSGESIHNPYEYGLKPCISPNTNIILGNKYQQFYDSIDIISEYNYQKDILDKYLRIYHVFENFMYKSPLVSLEREAMGTVFSIREFKRMYIKISNSEYNMLKMLFEEILALDYNSTQTFRQKLFLDWSSLISSVFNDSANIDILLKKLNITKNDKFVEMKFNDVTQENFGTFFSKLIYSFRNTIVHNRETEFHLTHLNLMDHPIMQDTAKKILEFFLIPKLEEIVFYLIANTNNIVWYDNSKLNLWEEN